MYGLSIVTLYIHVISLLVSVVVYHRFNQNKSRPEWIWWLVVLLRFVLCAPLVHEVCAKTSPTESKDALLLFEYPALLYSHCSILPTYTVLVSYHTSRVYEVIDQHPRLPFYVVRIFLHVK